MEFAVISWPDVEGGTLDLDHTVFSMAGRFVRPGPGTAVARRGKTVIAAARFNTDRTDGDVGRIRTIAVRTDRRGEGIGSRLLAGLRVVLLDGRYRRLRIAVNNPYAYQAAYRAGFAWTGRTSGMAELVLEAPSDGTDAEYAMGMTRYAERTELPDAMRTFAAERADQSAPEPVPAPEMRRPP